MTANANIIQWKIVEYNCSGIKSIVMIGSSFFVAQQYFMNPFLLIETVERRMTDFGLVGQFSSQSIAKAISFSGSIYRMRLNMIQLKMVQITSEKAGP